MRALRLHFFSFIRAINQSSRESSIECITPVTSPGVTPQLDGVARIDEKHVANTYLCIINGLARRVLSAILARCPAARQGVIAKNIFVAGRNSRQYRPGNEVVTRRT